MVAYIVSMTTQSMGINRKCHCPLAVWTFLFIFVIKIIDTGLQWLKQPIKNHKIN